MPSILHEALAQLFRNHPRLAPQLLERALGVTLPRFAEARLDDATFADLSPAEYRADLVVVLTNDAPELAIVVEVQLARDRRKLFSWPMYAVGLRARFECPTCVLVITTNAEVAAWAREPIAIGPANVFTPLVIGPESVPVVVAVEEAVRDPELFVLSVMAHGRDDDATASSMLPAAVHAMRVVDVDRAVLYFDLITHSLGPAAGRAFEELMDLENYEFQSDVFRRLIARRSAEASAEGMAAGKAEGLAAGKAEGLAAGKAEGLAAGKAEGLAAGKAEGLAAGKAEGLAAGKAAGKAEGLAAGKAESVVLVLRARGVEVTASTEARIRASSDIGQLDRWIQLAATVDAVEALFE